MNSGKRFVGSKGLAPMSKASNLSLDLLKGEWVRQGEKVGFFSPLDGLIEKGYATFGGKLGGLVKPKGSS